MRCALAHRTPCLGASLLSPKLLQVFSDDNRPLERGDSSSSASLLDSPLCRPLHASSAARTVPHRPLHDDDEGEEGGKGDALGRSFHSFGQSRCENHAAACDGTNEMPRVGSAPSHMGTWLSAACCGMCCLLPPSYCCPADWSWAAPNRRRSSVESAPSGHRARATPPPPFPLDDDDDDACPSSPLLECKPIGLDDFELLHVIGQVIPCACDAPPRML